MNTGTVSHPALRQLLSNALTPATLKRFLEDQDFPLVAKGRVSFVWVGDASQVELLRWIHGGVNRSAFQQVADSPLWWLDLDVTDGGRFEYKLGINKSGEEHWILDPLNHSKAGDPFGDNSVCKTFGYVRPEWSMPQGAPRGKIEPLTINSASFDETRREQIYLPCGYTGNEIMPLLIIHDGADYLTYADLATSLDNLIYAKIIQPIIVALVQTGDRPGEYSGGRRHARYLVNDLLPVLESDYAVSKHARNRILLGASLGAVASLSTVFRYPGVFGGVVLHSGSFILDEKKLKGRPDPVFRRIARLVKAFRRVSDMPELRAFVSTGELEGLAMENRSLARLLRNNGVEVLFKSAWDGHHWHNWRNQLRDGLVWVLR